MEQEGIVTFTLGGMVFEYDEEFGLTVIQLLEI